MNEEILTQEQKDLINEGIEVDARLEDVRAWKADLADGDKITLTQWMKLKSLPEAERAKAKAIRISVNKESKTMNEFLDDKFPAQKVKK